MMRTSWPCSSAVVISIAVGDFPHEAVPKVAAVVQNDNLAVELAPEAIEVPVVAPPAFVTIVIEVEMFVAADVSVMAAEAAVPAMAVGTGVERTK